jgi:4-amino-4-deoxy-L-arabinose transferase-like glycosyltransferase
VLRCFRLGEQSLWIDEVLTWYSAGGVVPLGWTELRENVHGPLYSLLLHAWTRIAGDAEWAMRAPSALFGTLTVPAMAWLAHRWLGREAAIPAAWLTACSPFLIWYSQEARNYALLILCACLASAALIGLGRRLRGAETLAYLAAAAAGLLSNLSFVLLAPVHLWWWIRPRAERAARLRRLGIVAAGLALITSPWFLEAFRLWDWNRLHPAREAPVAEAPLRGQTTFHPGAVPFTAYTFSVGYGWGPPVREMRARGPLAAARTHAAAIAIAALICGSLALLGLRALARRGRLAETALWLIVPVLLVSYVASQNFKVFHPRYLAVAAPVWLLLFAAAFADLRPRGRLLWGGALALLWSASLWNHYVDPRYGREDYRGAAALIRAEARPGDQVIAVYSVEPMEYYMRDALPVRAFGLGQVAAPRTLDATLDAALASAPGSWIVLSRGEDLDPEDVFARRIAKRFPQAPAYRTTGVRIWRLPGGDPGE